MFPVHHATEQIHAGRWTCLHEGPNLPAANLTTVKSAVLLQSISACRPIEHIAFTNPFQVLFVAQLSHAHSDPQSKHLDNKQTSWNTHLYKILVSAWWEFFDTSGDNVSPEWHLTLLAIKSPGGGKYSRWTSKHSPSTKPPISQTPGTIVYHSMTVTR